jgi:transposase-like protein
MTTSHIKHLEKKVAAWKASHQGERRLPPILKGEILRQLKHQPITALAKELHLPLSTLSSWQKQKRVGGGAKKPHKKPVQFIELSSAATAGSSSGFATASDQAPTLLLRRPDGTSLDCRGDISLAQLRALSLIFLGG